jgi:uncharacterized protein (TIGR02646 family)
VRHLDRAAVPAPACLERFHAPADRWEDLSWAEREEIRAQLGTLQKDHCAYCECDLAQESKAPHIDHFEQRSRAPQKTFDWKNLFWSCSHTDRCGKHKDRIAGSFEPKQPLKADVDDPRRFLWFTRDGEVFARAGLEEAARRRAEETIRVFALDHRDLIAARRAYLAGPYGLLQDALAADLPDDESRRYLDEEARAYEVSPFSAAILDLLGVAP